MAQTEWRDWANLSDGPAGLIADLVLANDVVDYLRFRAVCRSWRRCSTDPRGHSGLDRRFHPRHWIMLREQIYSNLSRRFINISTGECIKLELHELRDHKIEPTSEGLLLVLRMCTRTQLLNPFTRHATEFPPVNTLMHPDQSSYYFRDDCLVHGTRLGSSSGVTSDSKSFLLCIPWCCIVGIANPGDEHWMVVHYNSIDYAPPLMFLGHFYHIIGNDLMVLKVDTDQPPRLEAVAKLHRELNIFTDDSFHLVDNQGELFLVHRTNPRISRRRYDVYRLDLDKKTLLIVNSFNGRAMFMGRNFSFFVSPRIFGFISGDTIYLSFEMTERTDIEAYHLPDRSTKPANYILDHSMSKQKTVSSPHTIVDCLSLCDSLGTNFRRFFLRNERKIRAIRL